MGKSRKALIIVESPAKIKTLRKFLDENYLFESSVGHIRDLPPKEFGVDIEEGFEPTYAILPGKEAVVAKLKKSAKECETVYLSPDPDREGEAIAWHIAQILPKETRIKRVSFNSITKDAVAKALREPREIDMALVHAQQARRLLDRIVGYKISPILNRRIQRGKEGAVSAGRVQSVALKLVVDREREIEAFKPVEYWNLSALFSTEEEERPFPAHLYSVEGKKFEKEPVTGKEYILIGDKETADALLKKMKSGPYIVQHVERKEKKRNPVPSFITSTLQQEASRHHGFSAARTMSVAQSLYEGVDLGKEGSEGLITYMRTDSFRIVPEALGEARRYILENFGENYLPPQAKIYASSKSAQDAHEAIRPTNPFRTPEKVQKFLTRDQWLLYQLIWRRFMASQMMPAIYDTLTADISAGNQILLRATGSVLKFSGYLAVYEEKQDDEEKNEENRILPNLSEGQSLTLLKLNAEQAFTRPPPRYTEASLVKELEKSGIGRPSTYATIMNKIQSREYTLKESGRLKPTELGCVIASWLESNFPQIMNVKFTAQMEDDLELVAENQKEWRTLLNSFWLQFNPALDVAEKEAYIPKILTDIDCPSCGAKLQKVWFKSKYFYGCSRYPDCNYSAPIEELEFNREDYAQDFDWEQKCPKCGSDMKVRHGRFGAFLGCTDYPGCKGIINIPKKGESVLTAADMPSCPAIGCDGQIVARRSRYGKVFYSCSNFPDCDVIANDLSQLEVKYVDHPKTPYEKKKKFKKDSAQKKEGQASPKPKKKTASKSATSRTKASKSGISGGAKLSPALAALMGTDTLDRPTVVKKIWEYIKLHDLQDPQDKRRIIPDKALATVLGAAPVSMFHLNKLLTEHFI